MELFSELYGCYYSVVAKILHVAHGQGISRADINAIVEQEAFAESGLHLIPRLLDGEWALLSKGEDGLWYSKLANAQTDKPLTTLQKSWLKAILQDARIHLFLQDAQLETLNEWLRDVEPLFRQSDFHVFDKALDGDDYQDESYRRHFAIMLDAIKTQKPLLVEYQQGKGGKMRASIVPMQMQYSAKDDKFRVLAGRIQQRRRVIPILLNMGRVLAMHSSRQEVPAWFCLDSIPQQRAKLLEVVLHITRERNALERCMMQFAFYDKETETQEDGSGYRCRIRYNREDETELLIRILSFGPVVKVLGPQPFVELMRQRVVRQFEAMALQNENNT